MRRCSSVAFGLGFVAAAMAASPAGAQNYAARTVASGLNSPRGVTIGPDGALYIAESGVPGSGLSASGSVTRVSGGVQTRILTGLPSVTGPTGDATGPQDIAFAADGTGYLLFGLGLNPAARSGALGGGAANWLGGLSTFGGGSLTPVADVSAYEATYNPLGGAVDSNPFHLASRAGGFLVTDAGSNTLLNVTPGGAVSLVASFAAHRVGPSPASDSVPTGVAVAPDGSIYVAELTGAPFTAGAANIYHLASDGSLLETLGGFTDVTDIAFGNDGLLYVLEFDADGIIGGSNNGALIRVAADGTRQTIFSDGLVAPTGLAIGGDDSFYVSAFSPVAAIGRVLQISAVPEPGTWAMMLAGFAIVGTALRRRPATRSVPVRWPTDEARA